jgi:Trypsin-like peptidase domain/GYF domain 2/FHA domain
MIQLRLLDAQGTLIRELSLATFPARIGAGEGSEIPFERVRFPVVSGLHARIERDSRGDYWLYHISRTNPTLHNNQSLAGQEILKPTDTIRLGETGPMIEIVSIDGRTATMESTLAEKRRDVPDTRPLIDELRANRAPATQPVAPQVTQAPARHSAPSTPQADVAKKTWFYRLDKRNIGPVTIPDLQVLARRRTITLDTPVWKEGMEHWQPAGAVLPRIFDDEVLEGSWKKVFSICIYVLLIGGAIGGLTYLGFRLSGKGDKGQKEIAKDDEKKPQKEPEKVESIPQVAARCEPSVARVVNSTGTGSGFMIAPGIVATNHHVIQFDTCEHITVTFPSSSKASQKFSARILFDNPARDLALLKIESELTPLKLTDATPLKGSPVFVIGSPAQSDGQVSTNAITTGSFNNRIDFQGRTYLQINATINGGNSGGPVFDEKGHVIGVAVSKMVGREGMNMAIPFEDVDSAIEKAKTLRERDIAELMAIHNLREMFVALNASCLNYLMAMDLYVDECNESARKKMTLDAHTTRITPIYDDMKRTALNDDSMLYFDKFDRDVNRIKSSPDLPAKFRNDPVIDELIALYRNSKAQMNASRPPTAQSVADFKQKAIPRRAAIYNQKWNEYGLEQSALGACLNFFKPKIFQIHEK